ncbi:helix-turn-helix domain-containing protein [Mycobacterium intracellulare]|uniref:helix-turn-helix domain-containing protein n=1 Tax=Mycobacterium intracellulare TaxID=1767 RepID=UPI001CD9390F|nr:helix-turn-helix domain-containing protein [Mycobacterium intracellulare]MCA2302733.1 helix-turn-helix domain-containing protein [Mycobacterium intracellulare]MCA2344490.1 helix-turn-helix domain-containing protein [Mycobacterium intracellulare]UGU02700.1 helix-turn-helix domain-containing protein [Mycobacterium intracellulare]
MKHLTIAQAADILGVHPISVRRYISRGVLRGYRVGPRMIRLRAEDVEALHKPIGGAA